MKRTILSAALLCAALLSACAAKPADTTAQKSYEGFTAAGTHLTGGTPLEQINAKSLDVSKQDEDICVKLCFVQGSRIGGSESEQQLISLPAYDVSLLERPTRLVIELPGLAFWDYTRTMDLSGVEGVQGCFQHILADGDTVSLYVQLRDPCMVRVEEAEGALSLFLRTIEQAPTQAAEDDIADITELGDRYYVVADAYRDYCSGVISREMEMLPTLTADGERIVLISKAFSTPMEAEEYMEKTIALTQNAVSAQWSVMEIADGALPSYSTEMNSRAAREQAVLRMDGEMRTADIFIEDGLYLCTKPEKDGVLYSKRITENETGGDEYTYELLYSMDLTGARKQLFSYEFETIETVKYSTDARKLAVLERAAESAHLYVFDIATKEMLVDLSEVGFGDMISAFTWDALGSTIYAVSGTDAMQVHQYDFNVPDETKRHNIVDRGADEGSIAYCDGELYFAETNMQEGPVIYRIKPDGGVRKRFESGSSFELSPDNRYMAINASGGDYGGEKTAAGLRVRDMQSGEVKTAADDFAVYEFFFSRDGAKVYYFENRLSGNMGEEAGADTMSGEATQDDYPYSLWEYDIGTETSKKLMDLSLTSVHRSGLSDVLYLCYTDVATMGAAVRATYTLNVAN